MEQRPDIDVPSDEELTAYLDGELASDAAKLAALERQLAGSEPARLRLATLAVGGRPFRQAFDALGETAPMDRLRAGLDAALSSQRSSIVRLQQPRRRWFTPELIAASLAFLLFGGALGLAAAPSLSSWLSSTEAALDPEDAWMAAVASQISLEDGASISALTGDPAKASGDLAAVGQPLGLTLTEPAIRLPGYTFKKARLLSFGGKPIAQLLYVSATGDPLALCLSLETDDAAEPPITRDVDTIGMRYWRNKTRGLLLAGRLPQARLAELAGVVDGLKL